MTRDILALDQARFSKAFRKSPMKRAKLRGLQRNATVVVANVGTADDMPLRNVMLKHDEPLVREHAGWAIRKGTA